MSVAGELDALRTVMCDLIRSIGVFPDEPDPAWFSVDFNNTILADPYLEGTGWLPDRETAEGVANLLLPVLDSLALWALGQMPELGRGWTEPLTEATDSYATIVSAARDASDNPVVEEMHFGDAWFVASVALNLLSPDQQRMLDKTMSHLQGASA